MKTGLNFQDADEFYESLLNAHQGLSQEQSELLNDRLILLMANQLSDSDVLRECIAAAAASDGVTPPKARPLALKLNQAHSMDASSHASCAAD